MTSEISNKVTDARKQLSGIDDLARNEARFVAGKAASSRVFKSYIQAAEVFTRTPDRKKK